MLKSYFQDKFIKCVFGIEKLFSILKNKKLILCTKCMIVIQVALLLIFLLTWNWVLKIEEKHYYKKQNKDKNKKIKNRFFSFDFDEKQREFYTFWNSSFYILKNKIK